MTPTTSTEVTTTCLPFAKVEANGMPARGVTQPAGPQPQDTGDSRDSVNGKGKLASRDCKMGVESLCCLGINLLFNLKELKLSYSFGNLNTYTHAESPEWGRGNIQILAPSAPGLSWLVWGEYGASMGLRD